MYFFPLLTAYLILFQFCSKFDLDRGKDTMLHTDATMTNFILYITTPRGYFSASVWGVDFDWAIATP